VTTVLMPLVAGRESAESASMSIWTRLAPIVAFELYLNISILTFALGPWTWPLQSMRKLVVFVALAHAALLLGYLTAAFEAPREYRGRLGSARLRRWSTWLTFLLYLPTLLWLTGGVFDPIGALRDPATAYYRFQAMAAEEHQTAVISYIRFALAPLLSLAVPLGMAQWRQLSWRGRVATVAVIGANLSLFVFTGRNKGLVDFVLLLPWLVVIARARSAHRLSVRRFVFVSVIALGSFAGLLGFLNRNNTARAGGLDDPFYVRLFGGMQANPDNFLIRNRAPWIQAAALGLSFNQTHGYFALGLALDKPFQPTWGIGNSFFLQTVEKRLTGQNRLGARSYPMRLQAEDDWSITEFWHTTYTWFASDVSFPGVVVLLFLLGRLFARTWLDAMRSDNPYAVGLFVLLITVLYYLPTNNIVLGQPEGFSAFWVLTATWIATRGARLRRPSHQFSATPTA
jgi:hypothetical protein